MTFDNPKLYVLASPALGLVGGLTVAAASGASPAGICAAVVLAVLGAAAGQQARTAFARNRREMKQFFDGQRSFNADVAPVWSAQIETSRSQMETAVAALSVRFGAIVEKLDHALASADPAGASDNENAATLLAKSQSQLQGLVASLRDAMSGKAEMLRQVQDLQGFVAELQDMAEGVSRIAQQTNLLAINATIEAAHAGDRGRGFATVAQEVRALSKMSGETGRQIAEKIGAINAAIGSTRTAAEASSRRENQVMADSETRISEVLHDFQGLTSALADSAEQLRTESRGIQSEVHEALVQLQFQDRVSQILGHVSENIERMPVLVGDHYSACERDGQLLPLQSSHLLGELEATYAMADERAVHQRGATAPASAAKAPHDEITFF